MTNDHVTELPTRSSRDRTTLDVAGTKPPLGFRVEVVRQYRRRRTKVGLGIVMIVPILLAIAFKVGNGPGQEGGGPDLGAIATTGGFNFALFSLLSATGLLLVVVVALFAGDAVASEANWGSLRYLLAMPVPRGRLLRQKFYVAVAYSALASALLPMVALAAGSLMFGWHGIVTLSGETLPIGESVKALFACSAYIGFIMLLVASVAFMISTFTDSPLGAVGGAVGIVIISNIFNQVPALASARNFLPTHYFFSWLDLLLSPPIYTNIYRGILTTLLYSVVFLAIGYLRFRRKDITS